MHNHLKCPYPRIRLNDDNFSTYSSCPLSLVILASRVAICAFLCLISSRKAAMCSVFASSSA